MTIADQMMEGVQPRLTRDHLEGWYLCKMDGRDYVFHWDGCDLDDCNPHRHTGITGWNYVIDSFEGPMCFVGIDFPGERE